MGGTRVSGFIRSLASLALHPSSSYRWLSCSLGKLIYRSLARYLHREIHIYSR